MRGLRNYPDCDIANMDETPVWFEMPGKSTPVSGSSEISVSSTEHEEQRITVTLQYWQWTANGHVQCRQRASEERKCSVPLLAARMRARKNQVVNWLDNMCTAKRDRIIRQQQKMFGLPKHDRPINSQNPLHFSPLFFPRFFAFTSPSHAPLIVTLATVKESLWSRILFVSSTYVLFSESNTGKDMVEWSKFALGTSQYVVAGWPQNIKFQKPSYFGLAHKYVF